MVYCHCCLIRLVSYHCHRDQSRPDRVSPGRTLYTRSPPQRNPSTWTPEMAEKLVKQTGSTLCQKVYLTELDNSLSPLSLSPPPPQIKVVWQIRSIVTEWCSQCDRMDLAFLNIWCPAPKGSKKMGLLELEAWARCVFVTLCEDWSDSNSSPFDSLTVIGYRTEQNAIVQITTLIVLKPYVYLC